ncbi:MAG: biopolymer transporter ExbD [Verrucomicrobia bacterium]|nr:biopolymer transporter ExbD [Verrucomicrobiota bacterium]
MRKREDESLGGALIAMIDVVFQIIIFFVCTANLQDSGRDPRIQLAVAPHAQLVIKKDPREIVVDVDSHGSVTIARTPLSSGQLLHVLRKATAEYGRDVPVIVRADGRASHEMVRQIMDASAAAGIWRIKISALKEKGG